MPFAKRNKLKSFEIHLGAATMDRASGRIFEDAGNEIELRHQSREVLSMLAEEAGRTVSRDALIEQFGPAGRFHPTASHNALPKSGEG